MQLTYLPHGQPKTSSEEEGRTACSLYLPPPAADRRSAADGSLFSDTRKEGPSLLLVLKWGGELTPAGRVQAEELGRAFRCMYPGGQGETQTHTKESRHSSLSCRDLNVVTETDSSCHRQTDRCVGRGEVKAAVYSD